MIKLNLIKNRPNGTRHGCVKRPGYVIWRNMMKRCYDTRNKAYSAYGGRGILVDKRWHSLRVFCNWYDPKFFEGAQIDRINNDLSYSPENCRLVTAYENAQNTSRVKLYDFLGQQMTVSDAARKFKMPAETIRCRIVDSKLTPSEAVSMRYMKKGANSKQRTLDALRTQT